jgi:hypothetical protein
MTVPSCLSLVEARFMFGSVQQKDRIMEYLA